MTPSSQSSDYKTVTPYLKVPNCGRLIDFMKRAFGDYVHYLLFYEKAPDIIARWHVRPRRTVLGDDAACPAPDFDLERNPPAS